jgi:glycosyltransferase involved in cell wall biosynthesis
MAAGIPVIVSNFPLWERFVLENECGICVDPLSPVQIAGALEWILAHPVEAKKMGENGRKAVEERFSWGKESKKLIDLYERLQGTADL